MNLRKTLDPLTSAWATPSWVVRVAGWSVITALEYGLLAVRFDASHLVGVPLPLLPSNVTALASAVLTAALLLRGPTLARLLRAASIDGETPRFGWLALHVTLYAAFALIADRLFRAGSPNLAAWLAWLGLGLLASLSLLRWALGPALRTLTVPLVQALLAGALPGAAAVWGAALLRPIWPWLVASSLPFSAAILTAVFPSAVVDERAGILGVGTFRAAVRPECSGVEGLIVFGVLFSAYAVVCRKELRWPHALLLYPVGGALVFALNAFRIAALVAIGGFVSPAIAVGGFHSRAGWLSVCAVTVGVVFVAGRWPWLQRRGGAAQRGQPRGEWIRGGAVAYCLPLCVSLATSMVTGLAASGIDWLYGLRVATTGYVLWRCWGSEVVRRAGLLRRAAWGPGIPVGCALFVVWLLLVDHPADGGALQSDALSASPPLLRLPWIVARVVGSVIVVPLAEELAFRGYLQRRLASVEFESIPLTRPAALPVVVSALAFGAAHQSIVAGGVAGVVFSLVASLRGELVDAVVAHGVTNLLIAVAVLGFDAWWLW